MNTHLTAGLSLLLLCAGCAAPRTRSAPGFDPRVPLRVAVLPFVDRASGDDLVSRPLTAGIDLVPILSDDALTREHAATLVRVAFQANLERSGLRVLPGFVVDSLLGHHGVDALAAWEGDRAEAARRLGALLGADAVVFGEVLEWDRSYWVVESVTRVGARIELRDTASGALLHEGEARDLEASGVSKLPIAYSVDGALQAILGQSLKGLRNTLFATLSQDVSRQLVAGLVPDAERRAATLPPTLRFVARSAPAPEGEVIVVAVGDPGQRATFRLGDGPEHPMSETRPGTYRGALAASPGLRLERAPLTVRLVDRDLQATTMTLGPEAGPLVTASVP